MNATQKLKRLTAVLFKYYSNAKKCENGFLLQILRYEISSNKRLYLAKYGHIRANHVF